MPPGESRWRAGLAIVALSSQTDPLRAVATLVLWVAQTAGATLFALWLKLAVDAVREGAPARVLALAIVLAVAVVSELALDYLAGRLVLVLQEKTDAEIDRRLVALAAGYAGLDLHERPDHVTRLEIIRGERWVLTQSIDGLLGIVATLVRGVVAVSLLASVHPVLLVLPLFGLPALVLSRRTHDLFHRGAEAAAPHARLGAHLYEVATRPRTAAELRVFGLCEEIVSRMRAEFLDVARVQRKLHLEAAVLRLVTRAVFVVGYTGAVAFIVSGAPAGRFGVGDVVLTVVVASQVQGLLSQSAERLQWAFRTLAIVGHYLTLTDLARQAAGPEAPAPVPDALRAGIELEHVSFRYPGTSAEVLRDVSLRIPAGSTLAIVGANGAGKTTLVKLIYAFYKPTDGRITVDGVPLSDLDPARWRARTSGAFQDFMRFELLARESVGVGDLPAVMDNVRVLEALEHAAARDVLESLPSGLQTQLGLSFSDGVELSGGQWQKLAIGRGMMRRAPLLLVLDEPTASLDADTEHALFERYVAAARRSAGNGAITVLVSHRFSTVRMADRIAVLDGGRLVELGSHEELMALGGLYAELYTLQARAYA